MTVIEFFRIFQPVTLPLPIGATKGVTPPTVAARAG
jgi:hypothetical protein